MQRSQGAEEYRNLMNDINEIFESDDGEDSKSPAFRDYLQWVEDKGHITHSASSVFFAWLADNKGRYTAEEINRAAFDLFPKTDADFKHSVRYNAHKYAKNEEQEVAEDQNTMSSSEEFSNVFDSFLDWAEKAASYGTGTPASMMSAIQNAKKAFERIEAEIQSIEDETNQANTGEFSTSYSLR